MEIILITFISAFAISFLGTIPPGGINLFAIHLANLSGFRNAMLFVFGAVLIEPIFCFIALYFAGEWINEDVLSYIQWLAIPALILMGILTLKSKVVSVEDQKSEEKKQFVKGMWMSVINPQQIPFWLVYGSLMIKEKWLLKETGWYVFASISASLGTFLCLYLMVKYSSVLINKLQWDKGKLNKGIAWIFFSIAAFLAVKAVAELFYS